MSPVRNLRGEMVITEKVKSSYMPLDNLTGQNDSDRLARHRLGQFGLNLGLNDKKKKEEK
jgi:hypothetical protein